MSIRKLNLITFAIIIGLTLLSTLNAVNAVAQTAEPIYSDQQYYNNARIIDPILFTSSANITNASLGTASAENMNVTDTVRAADLTATDDLVVGDDASVGGDLTVSGQYISGNSTSNSNARFGPIEIQGYGVNNSWIGENVYYNGGYKYRADGYAAQFMLPNGGFSWSTAPSGTGGNAATMTSRMTLSNTGDLWVYGDGSFLTITDRTKTFLGSPADAAQAILGVGEKDGEIDHDTLPEQAHIIADVTDYYFDIEIDGATVETIEGQYSPEIGTRDKRLEQIAKKHGVKVDDIKIVDRAEVKKEDRRDLGMMISIECKALQYVITNSNANKEDIDRMTSLLESLVSDVNKITSRLDDAGIK